MRIYLLVAFVLLIFASVTHAELVNWTMDISVNDDGSNDWTAILTYDQPTARSDYFVLATLYNLETFADNRSVNCDVSEDIGTSIVCNDLNATEVVYRFHTKKFVEGLQNLKMFKYSFSVTEKTNLINIILRLPLGTALAEDEKLGKSLKPFEPDFGHEGTDGRRIYITWEFDKPLLGQPINVDAIYENVGFDPFTLFVVIIVLIIIVFVSFLVFFSKRHRVRHILPVLTESERKVMEILLREHGEVDQRVLVKETDFSKAKISRIITDLIARGVLEKISRGRKNLIKLKKDVKQPDSKDNKPKGEKQNNSA